MSKKLRFDTGLEYPATGYDENGTHSLPAGSVSTLWVRYKLVDDKAVDAYPDLSDQEVLELLELEEQEATEARKLQNVHVSVAEYKGFLGVQRRVAIRKMATISDATYDPIVADFSDRLTDYDVVVSDDDELLQAHAYLEALGEPFGDLSTDWEAYIKSKAV